MEIRSGGVFVFVEIGGLSSGRAVGRGKGNGKTKDLSTAARCAFAQDDVSEVGRAWEEFRGVGGGLDRSLLFFWQRSAMRLRKPEPVVLGSGSDGTKRRLGSMV